MRYVIIGGSVAGISAAKEIRENDSSGEIVMVSGEKSGPYFRPMIPLIIAGQKSEEDILYPEDQLPGTSINAIRGTVIEVDAKKKEVLLASGERRAFDSLLIATGGAPLKPAIPGLEGEGVYPLRSMAHAIQIRDAVPAAGSAVVIGGGLVGIKAALALREQGISSGKAGREVMVIETLPEILSGRLDRRGAEILRAAVVQQGVTVLTGENVCEVVRKQSAVSGVKLSSGRTVKTELVIVAAGSRPDIAFLNNSGIRTNRGILVDEFLRTNIEGVYAAGDAVEGRDVVTGQAAVSGLWSNAVEMGRTAGMNMAGGNVKYPGFLPVMNAAEIAGVPFISAGVIEPGNDYKTVIHDREGGYSKLVFKDDFLEGAIFVRNLKNAGIYTNLIKNRIPVTRLKDKVARRAVQYSDFLTL